MCSQLLIIKSGRVYGHYKGGTFLKQQEWFWLFIREFPCTAEKETFILKGSQLQFAELMKNIVDMGILKPVVLVKYVM